MSPRPVFLLTDFGLRDTFAYVGQMKAALLARAPGAPLVDLTHAVPPQDVAAGARALARCLPYLPADAVVLAVVDPGVGTARRPLAVTVGDRAFVAPDNGLLTPALHDQPWSAVALDPARVAHGPVSRTFHGRDLFAPAAARLALGATLEELGSDIDDPLQLPGLPPPVRTDLGWRGHVVDIDGFGNVVTDLSEAHLDPRPRGVSLGRPGAALVPLVATYGDVPEGALAALIGSDGALEIACNGGSAADVTGLAAGDPVELLD